MLSGLWEECAATGLAPPLVVLAKWWRKRPANLRVEQSYYRTYEIDWHVWQLVLKICGKAIIKREVN